MVGERVYDIINSESAAIVFRSAQESAKILEKVVPRGNPLLSSRRFFVNLKFHFLHLNFPPLKKTIHVSFLFIKRKKIFSFCIFSFFHDLRHFLIAFFPSSPSLLSPFIYGEEDELYSQKDYPYNLSRKALGILKRS